MIINCSWDPAKWRLIHYNDWEFQIKLHGDNLCMQVDLSTRTVTLEECDAGNRDQLFVASTDENYQEGDHFEIFPMDKPNWCLTQDHHPKNWEEIIIRPCSLPRRDETSQWQLY